MRNLACATEARSARASIVRGLLAPLILIGTIGCPGEPPSGHAPSSVQESEGLSSAVAEASSPEDPHDLAQRSLTNLLELIRAPARTSDTLRAAQAVDQLLATPDGIAILVEVWPTLPESRRCWTLDLVGVKGTPVHRPIVELGEADPSEAVRARAERARARIWGKEG